MPTPKPTSRGFTLIEVVIAAAIFVIIAVSFVPRINSLPRRAMENDVERLLDMLVMFAHRESTASQQVAIWHDPETNFISLVTMAAAKDGEEAEPTWVADRLVEPILLSENLILDEVTVDGQSVNGEDEWIITSVPAGGRPTVTMHLRGEGLDTTLVLDATSLNPRRLDADAGDDAVARESINLDEQGREHDKW